MAPTLVVVTGTTCNVLGEVAALIAMVAGAYPPSPRTLPVVVDLERMVDESAAVPAGVLSPPANGRASELRSSFALDDAMAGQPQIGRAHV